MAEDKLASFVRERVLGSLRVAFSRQFESKVWHLGGA